MSLPFDICRCHDDGCPEHETCLRWLLREDKGDRVVHCGSLYPYDQPLGEKCPAKIERNQ